MTICHIFQRGWCFTTNQSSMSTDDFITIQWVRPQWWWVKIFAMCRYDRSDRSTLKERIVHSKAVNLYLYIYYYILHYTWTWTYYTYTWTYYIYIYWPLLTRCGGWFTSCYLNRKGTIRVPWAVGLAPCRDLRTWWPLVSGHVESCRSSPHQAMANLSGNRGLTNPYDHWIGLRENLNRKPWFLPSKIELSCKFSHHPILWMRILEVSHQQLTEKATKNMKNARTTGASRRISGGTRTSG